jgi:hypothetical protein
MKKDNKNFSNTQTELEIVDSTTTSSEIALYLHLRRAQLDSNRIPETASNSVTAIPDLESLRAARIARFDRADVSAMSNAILSDSTEISVVSEQPRVSLPQPLAEVLPNFFSTEGFDLENRSNSVIRFPNNVLLNETEASAFAEDLIEHSIIDIDALPIGVRNNNRFVLNHEILNGAILDIRNQPSDSLESYRSSAFYINTSYNIDFSRGLRTFLRLFTLPVLLNLLVNFFPYLAVADGMVASVIIFFSIFRPLLTSVVDVRFWAANTINSIYMSVGQIIASLTSNQYLLSAVNNLNTQLIRSAVDLLAAIRRDISVAQNATSQQNNNIRSALWTNNFINISFGVILLGSAAAVVGVVVVYREEIGWTISLLFRLARSTLDPSSAVQSLIRLFRSFSLRNLYNILRRFADFIFGPSNTTGVDTVDPIDPVVFDDETEDALRRILDYVRDFFY